MSTDVVIKIEVSLSCCAMFSSVHFRVFHSKKLCQCEVFLYNFARLHDPSRKVVRHAKAPFHPRIGPDRNDR